MEIRTMRQIVENLMANAQANQEDPNYLRALGDVLMYNELHREDLKARLREAARQHEKVRTREEQVRTQEATAAAIGGVVAPPEFEVLINTTYDELVKAGYQVDRNQLEVEFRLAARLARLEGFAHRLIDLDGPESPERRWVNLDQIIEWAKIALGQDETDVPR